MTKYISIHKKKFSEKFVIKRNFLSLIKGIYKKTEVNSIFNGERLNTLPQRLRRKFRFLLSSVLLNMVLNYLASTIRQEK